MSEAASAPTFDPNKPFTVEHGGTAPLPFDPSKPFTHEEPTHTTLGGTLGAMARGAAPVATGAALGAAVGGLPTGGIGAVPGALIGGATVPAVEVLDEVYNPLAKKFGWPEVATPQEMTDRVLDVLKVPRPTTPVERTVEAATGGTTRALVPAAGAEMLAAKATSPIVKDIAASLGAKPAVQAIGGAAGGAAAQTAKEEGFGPTGQFAAGLVAGGAPYERLISTVPALARSSASDAARAAIENGYALAPYDIPPLGEKPGPTSRLLGSQSGKIATWQAASTLNQRNTNRLAAEGIDLHPDTLLNEKAFEDARQPASEVYREVEQSVPEVTLTADPQYRNAAARVGSGKGLVEKFFPRLKDNPDIKGLRDDLLKNERVPTSVAMQTVADLRHQANENFRAVGDAQKHALALAQREAADTMEDAIDRSVQNAPHYYAAKFADALAERHRASEDLVRLHTSLTKSAADLATNANVYTVSSAMRASRAAEKGLARAQAAYDRANTAVENWRAKLQNAHARDPQNRTLADRYRMARQKFAKIYNVENATNRTTGNVSAAGLARMYNKGAPLTGNLKVIADAFNTAPKSMQVPELFGQSQDWSALDFFGTMGSIAAGHPGAALAIVGRPVARATLLSKPYQRAILAPEPPSTTGLPLTTILNPGALSVVP